MWFCTQWFSYIDTIPILVNINNRLILTVEYFVKVYKEICKKNIDKNFFLSVSVETYILPTTGLNILLKFKYYTNLFVHTVVYYEY